MSLSYDFLISNQVISTIVLEVTAVIWAVLKDEVFEPLTPDFWRRKAAEFETMWDFPMCVGAMDGKHCFVQVMNDGVGGYSDVSAIVNTHYIMAFLISEIRHEGL